MIQYPMENYLNERDQRTQNPSTNNIMKPSIASISLLSIIAALGLSSCDQAREAEAAAREKAAAVAAEAKAKATAVMPDLKDKAAAALESAKEAGAGAIAKGGDLIDGAKDWGLEKMGVPEADGLLAGFGTLIAEAKTAVQGGISGEQAAALKAKWDALYAKSAETIKNLAPDKQEKMKTILDSVKAKWDELMASSKGGTVQ
jgi:hypothetical protein